MVSGALSLFCSKCFSPFPHGTGSLSVSREYLALPDGPGRFTLDSSCPALLRIPLWPIPAACTQLSCPTAPLSRGFHSRAWTNGAVLQPRPCRNTDGLGSSPVARHYWGNHCYFLFLRVLRCFSSPRWPPAPAGCHPFRMTGCPIRTSADQRPFAPPRGFSQLVTSFIASGSLGIRHAPFPTFAPPPCPGVRHILQLYARVLLCCLSHHVIDLFLPWRITDSNR